MLQINWCLTPILPFQKHGSRPLLDGGRRRSRLTLAGPGAIKGSVIFHFNRSKSVRSGGAMRRRVAAKLCFALVWALALPSAALAQGQTGSIAGVARDTTGAVLPGVTVEAASPALIEKVRTVVTDGAGAYRIVDLRPGVYTVTFTLTGFTT